MRDWYLTFHSFIFISHKLSIFDYRPLVSPGQRPEGPKAISYQRRTVLSSPKAMPGTTPKLNTTNFLGVSRKIRGTRR